MAPPSIAAATALLTAQSLLVAVLSFGIRNAKKLFEEEIGGRGRLRSSILVTLGYVLFSYMASLLYLYMAEYSISSFGVLSSQIVFLVAIFGILVTIVLLLLVFIKYTSPDESMNLFSEREGRKEG